MNSNHDRPAVRALRERLAGTARIEAHPLDVEDACKQYAEAGYDVSAWLRQHLETYGELTITWRFRANETFLKVAVEEALDVSKRNVRNYSRRLGQTVLPLGIAFSTEEAVLLADNGDILFGGDAGMQRVGNGFETSVVALVTDDWDKTFF
ncbi:SUKH-3 domain-containing protein [Streptomyces sp. ISL-22]|uniref:SUKH-3 domain-containing protein n=1 Tax=unclassified Streptomyces TaxID=2593676 RepID=UPI001BE83C26|nr:MULTISPECIES: SUKH-3 domain-containing protein [unclassified Streptomyces]MBT2423416.1 SUKH-3 domain-containing protein [Streptomyces sp. ISL-24]MBT2433821.1 SUKH-3 domain-containing protein [Streptomyces sp. ISL-22]